MINDLWDQIKIFYGQKTKLKTKNKLMDEMIY